MTGRTIDDLVEDFEFLDDWEERYKYIIELGRSLAPFPEAERTAANKVQGCVSQVWIKTRTDRDDGCAVFSFVGDSDALIVKGLIAILTVLMSGKEARDVAGMDAHAHLARFQLTEHLTPQRSNGLASMIKRIKAEAAAVAV